MENESSPPPSRRSDAARLRKSSKRRRLALRIAVGFGMILGLVIFFGGHVVVSSRMLCSWLNDEPERFLLEYDSASSWVPGVVRVRGLRIRGRDPNVEWFFRMDQARVSVSLLDLLKRRFHATRVGASGLVFHLRLRQERKRLSPEHAGLLPPIPGFADPPVKEPEDQATAHPGDGPEKRSSNRSHAGGEEPKRDEASEPRGNPWKIQIDRLVADPAPEIWVELYRYRGSARVTGGFSLKPRSRAAVGPATVEFLSGDLTLGKNTMLSSAEGRAECTIDPFDPGKVRGDDVWRSISGRFLLRGKVPSVEFVDYYLGRSPEPRLSGGKGTARVDVRIEHGLGRGKIDLVGDGVRARYPDATLRSDLTVRGILKHVDFVKSVLDLSGTGIELKNLTASGRHQDSREWWGRFDLQSAEIGSGLVTHVAVNCRDARPLFRLFDVELPGWAQGLLKLEGLTGRANVKLASSLVQVRDLEASGGKFHLAGQYRKKGTAKNGAFLIETGPLAVGLEIGGPTPGLKLAGARDWYRARKE